VFILSDMPGTGTFNSSAAKRLVVVIAAALIVVGVSACGSSASRSNLDPAAVVPASVPLYISAAVPTDGQVSQFHQLVTKLAGAKAWTQISNAFNRTLAKKHSTWKHDIEPWIGNHVGVAIMSYADVAADGGGSDRGLVLIFPTSNIKQALAYAKRTGSAGTVAEQDGSYMIVSDASTLAQFKAAGGAKLSSSASYTAVQRHEAGDNLTGYLSVHTLADQVASAASTAGTTAGTAAASKLSGLLALIPADASVGLGVSLTPQSARIDVIPHDIPSTAAGTTGGAGTVAGLPASSILAAALNITLPKHNAFVKEFIKGFSTGVASGIPGAGALRRAESIVDSVVPALGPLSLSFSGTSLSNLKAGLTLTPSNMKAADKLLVLAHSAITASGQLPVKGTAENFSLAEGPFVVHVGTQAGKVIALLGYPDAAAFLHPSSTLASNSAYQRAVGELPSGAKVPFYLSFQGLDTLLEVLPGTGETAMTKQILGKLSYLAFGSAPSDFRIVVGFN
jgi:hypothetical protein